jgi:hypothetical protein
MSGMTRKYRISNEYMRGSIGVAFIVDKMGENRMVWACDERKKQQ